MCRGGDANRQGRNSDPHLRFKEPSHLLSLNRLSCLTVAAVFLVALALPTSMEVAEAAAKSTGFKVERCRIPSFESDNG